MMDIVRNINAMSSENALAPAMLSPDSYVPYGDLSERIAIVSNYFVMRRLERHARVYVNIADSDLRSIVMLAAMNCGLVPVLLSSVSGLAQDVEFDYVVGGSDPLDPSIRPDLVIDDTVLEGKLADKTISEFSAREPEELLFIVGTSGTTGEKKLIANSVGLINYRAAISIEHDYDPGERVMTTIGGATTYSFMSLYQVLSKKACFVRPHPDPERCLKMINAYEINTIRTSAGTLLKYLDVMEQGHILCPSVKKLIIAGSLFPRALVRRAEAMFDAAIHVAYGTSETGGIATGRIDSETFETGYVGEINPNISLIYKGTETGDPSELAIVNEPALVVSRYVDGKSIGNDSKVYRLPDLGYVRGNKLYISGRDDEVYNFSGNKIAFSRIEAAVRQQADPADIGIVSTLADVDPYGLVIALVKPRVADLDRVRDEICSTLKLESARDHLRFFSVDAIPLNASGKIDRTKVRQLLDQGAD
ncbi:MAG: class I adenylate-forming enzyme family protein [Rhizobiaceae bacterium]|nr:class I adenylate-forming enzyme family protein [Rhizobiaceae bacterium]|tara:strand:+ start:3041 stop:4471 length:1431 start_codon:yes stop_codon:yes gene_type:complete